MGDIEQNVVSQSISRENESLQPKLSIESNGDGIYLTSEPQLIRKGSSHGLTKNSRESVSWLIILPWYLQQAVSGFFLFLNSTLRWASYLFVPASIAEMLITASELILSVVAARLIRRRLVSYSRWLGVIITFFGFLVIGFSHLGVDDNNEEESSISTAKSHAIGNLLILGQSLFSTFQDISDEIFLHEADFPATLLIGMEGLYGVVFMCITFPFFRSYITEIKRDEVNAF